MIVLFDLSYHLLYTFHTVKMSKNQKSNKLNQKDFSKFPIMMNSEKKYKHCIKQLDTLDKFTSFMEDSLIVNTLHLTDQELWNLIQQISQDVTETNPVTIPPLSVHQWMSNYYESWGNMKAKDHPVENSSESGESDESMSSSYLTSSSDSSHVYTYSSDDTVLFSSDTSESDSNTTISGETFSEISN